MDKIPLKLSYGIMTHGMVLSKWQNECIKHLEESGIAEVKLIINDACVSESKNSLLQKLKNYLNKHFVYKISSRFLFRVPAFDNILVKDVLKDVSVINCKTLKKGKFSEYFYPEDIEQIKSYNLDFVLRFGFNIIKGDILKAPKYGVWSYHHGNELKFRGGPAGFWEIYKKSKTNGVVLQQLNDLIDAGVIINRRSFQTVSHSYSEHLNKLLTHSTDMPLQVCKLIIYGDESSFQKEHSSTKAPMNRLPNNWQMINFLIILFANRIKFHIDRLFKQEQWDIGIMNAKVQDNSVPFKMEEVKWWGLRKGSRYAADSFCFSSNKTNYVVFEDYDYKARKGKISLLEFDENGDHLNIKTILEKPYHLAYPFVFQYNNDVYLIPETADNGTIELRKWNEANKRFDFEKVLINIAGVDASIVFYDERWWIFCGLKNDLPNEKLHIFYADKLTGPYKAHNLNPVKTDPAGSRPAGQFVINNGNLFRPAQHSVKWYGEKISWFKINMLTPRSFSEEYVGEMKPQSSWEHNKGLHTFSQTSKFIVIDAKKRASGWHAFFAALKN